MRDLLASNRTLLAWLRTAVAFAGLGFVVARFGTNSRIDRMSAAMGIFMEVTGLLLTIAGLAQHRSAVRQEPPPPGAPRPTGWPAYMAAALCALACALLTAYLAVGVS
jgi:uncharacterized membrane protein YidH (DUF202 family)